MKLRSALLLSFLLLITHGCVAVPEKTPESRLEPGMELDFMFAEDEAFWGRSLEETSMSMTVRPSWCEEGCNLQVDMVCGIDGITYANECLAVCQGVEVENRGPCREDQSMLQGETAAAESYDEEGIVHLDTMERYRSEGFKLTFKRKLAPENETIINDQVTIDDQDDLDDEGQEAADVRKIRAVRLSFDRFEYVADYEVDEDMPHDLSPFDPDLDDGTGKRGLRVIGDDTRTRVTNTFSPSNRIVGQLDYFNRINSGRCSGTVISSDAVLTAGHCVHTGGPSGGWMDVTSFAPARYRTNLGNIISPYGNFRVTSITTFQGWSLYGDRTYDVAVVKLSPRNSRNIGSYVGYAGLRSTTWNNRVLASCSVRGYPGDKLNGDMWTSGLCGGGFFRWINAFGLGHYCDTFGGMSGSAHMTVSRYISAVHVAGTLSRPFYNISVLLNGAILQGVIQWARR